MAKKYSKEIWVTAAIVGLFLASSYFSDRYAEMITAWMVGVFPGVGMLVYFVAEAMATVVAPVSALPLLPLAVTLWGSFWTAILSYAGWLAGSVIAFLLSRRFGRPLVAKFFDMKRIEKIEKLIGEQNIFLTVVLLRVVLPADLLSYALGLFTTVRFAPYFWATALGLMPFSFIFSYSVSLPIINQLLLITLGATVLFWWAKRSHFFD